MFMMIPLMSRLYALALAILFLLLPMSQLEAHSYPTRPGLSAELNLAASWRSDNQRSGAAIENEEVWQLPGLLMGGHAEDYEEATSLDELTLLMHYLTKDLSYAGIKLGSHGGTELDLEEALIGQLFDVGHHRLRLEAGLMKAFFSPNNHRHPSTDLFSLSSLGYSAFLGGHVHDTGVRATWGQEERGFSAGVESYKGSHYPAAGNAGLHAAYLRHAHQGFHWQWQLQGWYLMASAERRTDDRSPDGHSHGGVQDTSGFTGTFDGDTEVAGLFAEVQWNLGHRKALTLGGEFMQMQVDGRVEDEAGNRQLLLDGDYQALSLEPGVIWGQHRLGLRYERLSIQNTLTGAAANTLGAEANLISDGHDPHRLSLAWLWQASPGLGLRAEWMRDKALLEYQPDVWTLGVVWTQQIK